MVGAPCPGGLGSFHGPYLHLTPVNAPFSIFQVIGLCSPPGGPLSVVTEYMPHGDLHQFLRKHKAEGSTILNGDNSKKVLTKGCLLHIASQIAAGMR